MFLPMVELEKMEGVHFGKERLAGEFETLTGMDDTVADYVKLGTMDSAVFDEHFEIDLPQRLTRGFVGPRVCCLAVSPLCLSQLVLQM